MTTHLKEHGVNISLSTVATLVPVLAIVWLIVKPALTESISSAVADDFKNQIALQTAPLQNAFKTLLKGDIDSLKKGIAVLEFKEEHERLNWTSDDARLLTEKKIRLVALEEAYRGL